ncbi:MAG: hypothetical protein KF680_10990 [Cryobacterium sp.]|nr:hypothetical protein [Cryobacterium sp.]
MTIQHRHPLAALGLAIAIVLAGCSAPTTVTPAPDADDSVVDQGNGTPTESILDPAVPWPTEIPRPSNIVYEFSGKNPLGDGAVREIRFLASGVAEVQAYIDSLISAGWESGFGNSEPMTGDDGSVSWLLTTDQYMGTVSTDNSNDPSVPWSFSILG